LSFYSAFAEILQKVFRHLRAEFSPLARRYTCIKVSTNDVVANIRSRRSDGRISITEHFLAVHRTTVVGDKFGEASVFSTIFTDFHPRSVEYMRAQKAMSYPFD
jgi:hypothetical protein